MSKADQNSDPYNSAIIETAEEVEVPEVSLEPFESLAPPLDSVQPPLGSLTLGSLAPLELLASPAQSDVPPPQRAAVPEAAPPFASTTQQPTELGWLARARRHPALGMVVLPVSLAALLVLPFSLRGGVSAHAQRRVSTMKAAAVSPPTATTLAAGAGAPPRSANLDAAAAAAASDARDNLREKAALDALDARDATSLSVQELLLLNERHADRKRAEVRELYRQLEAEPERFKDTAIRARLLRLALDPDTSAGALASMSRAPSPIGPDLLFEVWSSRQAPSNVAELARSLLLSREVRPGASPSLAVALDLRSAASCEDVQKALPRVQADGDVRSIPTLAKVAQRRGCGPSKQADCYACLRPHTQQLLATIKAVQRRKAPRP